MSSDSLLFLQKQYGWLEYTIPTNMISNHDICCPDLPPEYDTLCSCYLDSIKVLVHIDSTEIPQELFNWFQMSQVTKSVWVGMFMYRDEGYTPNIYTTICNDSIVVDTLYGTREHLAIMVHIMSGIGEVLPEWIGDQK